MIYFLSQGYDGPIKIGYTDNSAESRRSQCQVGNPYKLYIMAVMDGDDCEEQKIHNDFSSTRLNGEWFKPNVNLLDFIHKKALFHSDWITLLKQKIASLSHKTNNEKECLKKLIWYGKEEILNFLSSNKKIPFELPEMGLSEGGIDYWQLAYYLAKKEKYKDLYRVIQILINNEKQGYLTDIENKYQYFFKALDETEPTD